MRKLILIADDLYVRNFIDTDAFAAIEGPQTWLAVSESVRRVEEVAAKSNYVGTVSDPANRAQTYELLRGIYNAAGRRRSFAMDVRAKRPQFPTRAKFNLLAHPSLRRPATRRILNRLGPNESLEALLDDLSPDLVISPTAGTDSLTFDVLLAARRRGIETLMLVNGWDNMSSKFNFPYMPTYLAVWGDQTRDHAIDIHGHDPSRVFVTGIPTFQRHFAFDPVRSPSPYSFPYVLFAGSSAPFDELGTLHRLESIIDDLGDQEIRIVYRPHYDRQYRRCADFFDEADFKRTILDEQVREPYLMAARRRLRKFDVPSLDYFPPLLGHARLVISSLSTMILEAAILETPVVALAFSDGFHKVGLETFIRYEHFGGIDSKVGVKVCRDTSTFSSMVTRALREPPPEGMRESIRPWLYFDDRSYAEHLRETVESIERIHASASSPTARALAGQGSLR